MDKNTIRYHIRRIEDNKSWIRQIVRETYDYFNPCDYKKLDYSYQVSWSAANAFTQNIFWDKFNEKKLKPFIELIQDFILENHEFEIYSYWEEWTSQGC